MQNEKKRIEIRNLLPEELKQAMNAMGQPSYRSGQIFKWLNQGVEDFAQMTNIPDGLRDALSQQYYIYTPKILAKQVSKKRRNCQISVETGRRECGGNSADAL